MERELGSASVVLEGLYHVKLRASEYRANLPEIKSMGLPRRFDGWAVKMVANTTAVDSGQIIGRAIYSRLMNDPAIDVVCQTPEDGDYDVTIHTVEAWKHFVESC